MAISNFSRCLAQVLRHEGGFTRNPKDPGNWTGGKVGKGRLVGTQKGVSAAAFPNLDIPNLTDAQIANIYKAKYFIPAGCVDLPVGVDFAVFDPAVNSGVSRAKKWHAAAKGAGSDKAVIQKICAVRLSFLRGLSTFKTFGKGWTRRVAEVEATAVSWALAASGSKAVKTELRAEAVKANAAAGRAKAQAAGAGAAAPTAALAPTTTVVTADLWPYAVAVVVVLLAVSAIVLARRSKIDRERASAYLEAATRV